MSVTSSAREETQQASEHQVFSRRETSTRGSGRRRARERPGRLGALVQTFLPRQKISASQPCSSWAQDTGGRESLRTVVHQLHRSHGGAEILTACSDCQAP